MKNYIVSNPKIMGGALVIAGTRISMARILYLLKEGCTIDQVHDQYNWISKEALKGAIAQLAAKLDHKSDDQTILQA